MVTTVKSPLDFLFVLPEPREIALLGGLTELSEDVRLVTSNVAPLYRKTMRTVLATAGIKVVANKKKFIIEVKVEPAELFDFKGVSERGKEEYYEVELLDNAVTVRTATQLGALWGAHTLAGIYHAKSKGHSIPNMKIRDWADYPMRAAFLTQQWGMERWTQEEWTACIERLATGKVNAFAIPFDTGCRSLFAVDAPEGILVPTPDQSDWQQDMLLPWYSPGIKIWRADKVAPRFQTEGYLPQLLVSARENGLNTMPMFSVLGETTNLARLAPEISARNAKGAATGAGYCLSAPETRKVLGAFYTGVMDRHFAGGCDYAVLHLGTPAADSATAEPACACAKCKKKSAADLAREQVVWLTKLLHDKGVKTLVIWSSLPADAAAGVLNATLAKDLAKDKLATQVIIAAPAAAPVKKGAKPVAAAHGLRHWITSPVSYTTWQPLEDTRKEVEQVYLDGLSSGAEGAACETILDSIFFDHIEHFASQAWGAVTATSHSRKPEELAELHAGNDRTVFIASRKLLETAVFASPDFTRFLDVPSLPALFTIQNGQFDLGPTLKNLCGGSAKALRPLLPKIAADAQLALKNFCGLLDKEPKPDDTEIVKCLACEAVRVAAIAQSLDVFATVYEGMAKKKVDAKAAKLVTDLHGALVEWLNTLETRRAKHVAPLKMAELSPFLAMADQVTTRMKDIQAAKLKTPETLWTVTPASLTTPTPTPVAPHRNQD